jgi:hypothetical protein
MARRGHPVLFLIVLFAAAPLFAQTANDDRVHQLEQKLDALTQQIDSLRQELSQLKGAPATPTPAPAEDLTKIGVVTPSAPAQPAAPQGPNPTNEQPSTAMTDVQTINNVPNPGASKVFNPDTSVIANFSGKAGRRNDFEFPGSNRQPMQLEEAEVAFQAFVDPYAKANFFFSVTPAGIDVEEGYAQFVTLPYDLTAKVGKFKALFGKANTWHSHVRPWVDQPLVIHNFFGDEQFHDDGISVSKIFPNSFAYTEGTVEVFKGEVAGIFGRQKQSDLAYNSHLKLFKDISENSNIEVGGSYARGKLENLGGTNQFAGLDVTYRWKPLVRGLYNSLIARFEGIVNDRPDLSRNLRGAYASLDYQLGQRWFTGVRLDRADHEPSTTGLDPFRVDKGVSATLTFWPSEFSQVRGQLRHTRYGSLPAINELLFQLQFAIGAHGAHAF